jgi:GMP synthase (glutamine-hydrolysing)
MVKLLNIHYLQHVPFEGLGSMEPYFLKKGHKLTATQLYKGQRLPALEKLDWLIVMGGPMSVYDENRYSWLKEEKEFIKRAIDKEKVVLGICLGAQLIANVLGAQVKKNHFKEIGWFNIERAKGVDKTILGKVFPGNIEVFHWHGDTFDIPERAILLASSEACHNQGFIIDNRVIGLQFHLETTLSSAKALIENCKNELTGGKYIQTEAEIISSESKFAKINKVMQSIIKQLENKFS